MKQLIAPFLFCDTELHGEGKKQVETLEFNQGRMWASILIHSLAVGVGIFVI